MDKRKSFTLIELLVVIVIIGILAGVIMISTSSSIDKANFAKAQAFSSTVQNELLSNLVSEWTFDEPEVSGKTLDSWGNNDGTVVGPDYVSQSSKECVSGGCYNFVAVNVDYIMVNDSDDIDRLDEITISVWVKNDPTSSGTQMVLEKSPSGTTGYNLLTYGNFQGRIYPSSIASSKNVRDNLWHHCVMKNKSLTNEWNLYVDGSIVASQNGVSVLESDQPLYIGTRAAGGSLNYDGLIDEVRIYNKALSSAQIKQNYIAGLNSMLSNGTISKEELSERINTLAYEQE